MSGLRDRYAGTGAMQTPLPKTSRFVFNYNATSNPKLFAQTSTQHTNSTPQPTTPAETMSTAVLRQMRISLSRVPALVHATPRAATQTLATRLVHAPATARTFMDIGHRGLHRGKCFTCGSPDHYSKDCSQPPRCHRCGVEGHITRDCPQPMKCFRCGGDHKAAECTEEKTCYKCGVAGHVASDCALPVE